MAEIVARIGVPIILGGAIGGVGMYMAVDAVCKSFKESPWISGVVGAMAGGGAAYFVSTILLK